ncbi:Protein of unknown function [Pseudoxanthomonas sp. GM95]|uniref:DUF3999 domain-containing protein n=1 Tax=Pseudoxanthomonas sp. GM95 TaxID=1881043 RepID=UPI0008D01529|nr:DUF3999 domain-containing protein [Pseudoxanthomonas sp. GM95]SEL71601.1 Protein of unknown function [Pseudoxanthomonas sp. GM95]
MKRFALMLLVLPLSATAASVRDDYAQQWPMQLSSADAGAYRVVVSDAVYRAAQSPTLADVAPLNAQGEALPATLLGADAPLALPPQRVSLPVFPLPSRSSGPAGDLRLIAQRDASGAVTRIETQLADAAASTPTQSGGWLLDVSALKTGLQALWLNWQGQPPMQAELRLEGSEDLHTWFVLDPRVSVVELDNGRQRLSQRRIALTAGARYLRLTPVAGAVPALQDVQAEIARVPTPTAWQSVLLEGKAQAPGFEFVSPGRYPVGQVDVVSSGNTAVEWIVQSRDSPEAPWVQRAGPWLVYQVGGAQRSPPKALQVSTRDRYWRLLPSAGRAVGTPRLQLGYQPEVVVFLAQGAPPYALAAGSGRAKRADAPLQPMIAALSQARGAQWQPAPATLAATPQPLAGEAALKPAAVPINWKSLLLWALLIVGAAVVAGFAISLLRGRQPPDGA